MNLGLQREDRRTAFAGEEKVRDQCSFGSERRLAQPQELNPCCRNDRGDCGNTLRRLGTGEAIMPFVERDVVLHSSAPMLCKHRNGMEHHVVNIVVPDFHEHSRQHIREENYASKGIAKRLFHAQPI